MSRRGIWMLVLGGLAVAAVVIVTVVAIWTRSARVLPAATVSRQQAEATMAQYLKDTLNAMPGHPTSNRTLHSTDVCDDPADRAPAGSQNIGDTYELSFASAPDNTQLLNTMHDYWVSKGYHINIDERSKPTTRTLVAENPHDGFRVGVVESNVGTLGLTISTPCLVLTS